MHPSGGPVRSAISKIQSLGRLDSITTLVNNLRR
jgi:hypothetical protein